MQATDGSFYGTTGGGGANQYYGTVFKITPSGTLTTLYSFCSQDNCTDGYRPYAVLLQASDGNFYGTTVNGGTNNGGTVFKITPSGTLTTLYNFCSQPYCPDGEEPFAGLVQGTDGNFYGTTYAGGTDYIDGTVFKITPSGTLTTLHSFGSQPNDGSKPQAGLVLATDGNFYGTTLYGGANNNGTVFRITPSGTLTTLYSFCSQSNCTDGSGPDAGLVQAADGNFYGTTQYGGGTDYGTVFKITLGGTLTTLHSFTLADGAIPMAGLVQAIDGDFYGTTQSGGRLNYRCGGFVNTCGTVFKITPAGTLTTVYKFCAQDGCADGTQPLAALVQASDGNFYGTTWGGGAYGGGTVFRLVLPRACIVCPSVE